MNPDAKFILAHDLDDAGVQDWQDRLIRARERDNQEMLAGVVRLDGSHFDREWAQVKRGYYAATADKGGRTE